MAARPAAAPCAAEYAWGEDGSNQCPTSYYAIVNAAACATAATAVSKAYRGRETDPSFPSGCYFHQRSGGFFLNADAVGAGVRGAQLLCSGAANLARPAQAPRGTIGYSRGTIGHPPGLLKARSCCAPVRPISHGRRRHYRVLTGYSRGYYGALPRYCGVLTRYHRGSQVSRSGAQGGARRGARVGSAPPFWLGSRGGCNGCSGYSTVRVGYTLGYRRRAPLRACMVDRTRRMRRSLCVGDRDNTYVLPTHAQAASLCQRMRLQPSRPPERQRQQRRRSASMVLRHHSAVSEALHVCAQR